MVSCVRQSPTNVNTGHAAAHLMPSTPGPLPAIIAAFVSHQPDKILPKFWGSCLLPLSSPLDASKCLCLAWGGLGLAGLWRQPPRSCLFCTFRGPSQFIHCTLASQISKGLPVGRVAAVPDACGTFVMKQTICYVACINDVWPGTYKWTSYCSQ